MRLKLNKKFERINYKYAAVIAGLLVIAVSVLAYNMHRGRQLLVQSSSAAQQDAEILAFHQKYVESLNLQTGNSQNGGVQMASSSSQAQAAALDGVSVDASKVQRPFAVVVENHPQSRPQAGLSQADVVYEALAEGGITRFLAVFQSQNVKTIGPVRSARTYFNDWAQELGAVLAHVGGNSDALYYLHKGVPGVTDADQYYNGSYFWRTKNRQAPHNVYTSTNSLHNLAANQKLSLAPSYRPYTFKADAPTAHPAASTVAVQFSTPQFSVKWQYNQAANSYRRYIAGKPDVDSGNNKQIQPKNVIVQIVKNWPVKSDTVLAISMGTRDFGAAYYFLDGKEVKGTWRFVDGHTVFYDENNMEMQFNRGQMWIEAVPPEFQSSLSWK